VPGWRHARAARWAGGEGQRSHQISGHKTKPKIEIEIGEITTTPKPADGLEVWTALPKGDRLESMIDSLSQLGVNRWRAVLCDRSERKWSSVKPEKLERTTHESAKQCGRAWFMEIGEPIKLSEAIDAQGVIVADAGGGCATSFVSAGTNPIVLIGPEGGWSDAEREHSARAGVPTVRLGSNVLRLETAAVAAASMFVNLNPTGTES
jgi:16S rRNA (uracil1498-N3)-methyltransferase